MIMNVNSPISGEVVQLQQNLSNHRKNKVLLHLYKTKGKHFFKESNLLAYLTKELAK